jgi:nucleotide-binding universal stress UspA family protein
MRIRNVFFSTDFSSASRPAFRRALAMASGSRATLWIGHVIPDAPLAGFGSSVPRLYREMDEYLRRDAERGLGVLAKTARRSGARTRTLLLRGVPHEAIRRAARKCRADLVVLGTHGRNGVSRFLVGSVAARVIATAPCPVLTVRSR